MNEDLDKQFQEEIITFATQYSLERVKTESPHFIRDYKRDSDGRLILVSEKALIRTFGRLMKVPIGENEECKNYAEAEAFAKKYVSEYFKKRRDSRSDEAKRKEARWQKQYRERRKAKITELKRDQN